MAQTMKMLNIYRIPAYAICALEYGEYGDHLEEADIQNIKAFEEKLAKQCPNGYHWNWQDLDNPYFSSCPEFGKPADVVDLEVYRIVKYDKEKLLPAPIDGKNVGDDFGWWCDEEYVENQFGGSSCKTHELLFWNHGVPCVLTYTYGSNKMSVTILTTMGGDIEAAMEDMMQKFFSCNSVSDDLMLEYEESRNKNAIIIKGWFYFWEDADEK